VIPAPVGPRVPTAQDAARIALDYLPALGDYGPPEVLGPWVEELDPRVDAHRRALVHALAHLCFAPLCLDGTSPFHQWSRRKPPVEERAAFRAVSRAPLAVWTLLRHAGRQWVLGDRLGLPAPLVPDQPVRVPAIGAVDGMPGEGDLLLARLARGGEGWVAFAPLGLRGDLADERLHTWVEEELEGSTALLQSRGQALVRRLHTWAWAR